MTSVDFARLGRVLAGIAKSHQLRVPDFRTPRNGSAAGRSIQRRQSAATVAVRYRNRPAPAVVADMIEGIVQANSERRLGFAIRDELWLAALAQLAPAGPQDLNQPKPGDTEAGSPAADNHSNSSNAPQPPAPPDKGHPSLEVGRRAA